MNFRSWLHFGLVAGAFMLPAALHAQTWDTSGNTLLSGKYYFRELIISVSEAASVYGNITFNGAGSYTIDAVGFDCDTVSCATLPYQVSGSYSIAASGYGFLVNQLLSANTYGLVGSNGVFVASSTESGTYDLFIAAPVSGQAIGTLQGGYSIGYLYPVSQQPFDALLGMTFNGNGSVGSVSVSAYASSPSPTTQTIGGVKYIVSNNAFKVTFPNSNTALITGDEYFYSTPDGSFVFGGSPEDFDMLVGVRTTGNGTSASAPLSGTYYEAGMDIDDTSLSVTGESYLDTFYGAFNAANQVIVGHQRIQNGGATAYGYVYHDAYGTLSNNSYTDIARSRQFFVANGYRIGVGIGPYPAISVAIPGLSVSQAQAAAIPGGGSGSMFLNPMSALNTASYAPFTSGISSGELIDLTGTNLGPVKLAVALKDPLPTTLAGVQVLINGTPVPIMLASATEIYALVPFATPTPTAQIQVTYQGAASNMITAAVNLTTSGIYTTPIGGVSRANAFHANGTPVTPANPAKVNEVVSMYVTGLGDVTPPIVTGSVASSKNPSTPINPFIYYVDSIEATPIFAGLAPGLAGLYELEIAIPTGVTTGDVFLDIAGVDSYSSQAIIAVSSATSGVTGAEPEHSKAGSPRRRSQGRFTPPHVGPRRTIKE
ncbi:MAG TPA: IPT/TIG domain-containing protein [Bryobacteraceae bacterium]|jgi:uncharacterized protein (TIGR03437 family)